MVPPVAVPEGDTLHRAATKVGAALGGCILTEVGGSHPAIRSNRRRLLNATVEDVTAIGKHLVVQTSAGWSLRTHLGMTGSWHTYLRGEPWRITPGKARVVLGTERTIAVCFAAPHVELGPTEEVLLGLERIGPDLALQDPPFATIIARAAVSQANTMADLLLDQQVGSGIGNVYKSEVLYLERQDPDQAAGTVSRDRLERLYRRANRLLLANLHDGRRSTTGNRGRQRTWVYGRSGEPCRRCGTIIRSSTHGPLDRVTYWCPTCQAAS